MGLFSDILHKILESQLVQEKKKSYTPKWSNSEPSNRPTLPKCEVLSLCIHTHTHIITHTNYKEQMRNERLQDKNKKMKLQF